MPEAKPGTRLRVWWVQTALIVALLAGGLGALAVWLREYLAGLSNPLPLSLSFCALLALSCWDEAKSGGRSRLTVAGIVLQFWLFALAARAASILRVELLDILHQAQASPEVVTFIGTEYHKALSTPIVGYGACFTGAVALGRWLILPGVRRIFYSVVLDAHERVMACPHCGARMAH
jgi:hypothetical protein